MKNAVLIEGITRPELASLISEIIRIEFNKVVAVDQHLGRLLSPKAAAEMLDISISCLEKEIKNKAIPTYKFGKKQYYRLADIHSIIIKAV